MSTILEIAVSNAVVASLLALLAAGISRWYRRPALAHSLWLLVLLKLVTPPIIPVQTSWIIPAAPNPVPQAACLGNVPDDSMADYPSNSANPTVLMNGNEIATQTSFSALPPTNFPIAQ